MPSAIVCGEIEVRIVSIIERGLRRFICAAAGLGAAYAACGQVQEEWVARYNGPGNAYDRATAMAVDSAGNVYVTGWSRGGVTYDDYATLKYDPNGNLLWERRYHGPGDGYDVAYALALDSADNVYVTGVSWQTTRDFDYTTIKYDTDGNLLWTASYDGPTNEDDYAYALVVDDAGNVYVTGWSGGGGHLQYRDYATLKYDTDGNQLWVQRYNGPGNSWDEARALAVDSVGNVFVTGLSTGSDGYLDYATFKYDPDGNQLWIQRYNGPGNGNDFSNALAVDAAGNVYVTGNSTGSGTNYDYATLKYDPNGNQLWERRYNGPGNGLERPSALALDGADNVYVTGYSEGSGTSQDFATMKYDSDGALLWERRYNDPANGSDSARALELDGVGNVYVTGYSEGAGTGYDYATLKYDPDGNLLWEQRYNGGGSDRPNALAVDGTGNVYVAGLSEGAGTGYDYATIKYSQDANFVVPDSFLVVRGLLTGGGLGDLFISDDLRLDVRAGLTLFFGEAPLQVLVVGTSPVEVPGELRFKYEASVNTPGLTQSIQLFNYVTSLYEEVDLSVPGASDAIVEVVITTDPGRFVQAGTREMRAKVVYQRVGFTLLWPWSARLDQTVWTIVP